MTHDEAIALIRNAIAEGKHSAVSSNPEIAFDASRTLRLANALEVAVDEPSEKMCDAARGFILGLDLGFRTWPAMRQHLQNGGYEVKQWMLDAGDDHITKWDVAETIYKLMQESRLAEIDRIARWGGVMAMICPKCHGIMSSPLYKNDPLRGEYLYRYCTTCGFIKNEPCKDAKLETAAKGGE